MERNYLTRAKYEALMREIEFMESEGQKMLGALLASSPGSEMGRPNDLPAHQLAGEFLGHLQDAKAVVNSAVIIDDMRDECGDQDTVVIGSTVHVRYDGDDDIATYTILGKQEVDLQKGHISCWSPIGSALVGNKRGSTVIVKMTNPPRELHLHIANVEKLALNFDYDSYQWKKKLETAIV